MQVFINKRIYVIDGGATVADALAAAGMSRPGVAVARGNKVVRKADWNRTVLTEGDELTVITAVCGG